MSKQVQHKEYLLVEVEEGEVNTEITNGPAIFIFHDTKPIRTATRIPLPPGSYSIVGKASELSEEQAGEIVERRKGRYNVYKSYLQYDWWHSHALESFASLLKSHNMKAETTIVIKKI